MAAQLHGDMWVTRAERATQALIQRYVGNLWGLPGVKLGRIAYPPASRDRWFYRWHYWWQAHLVEVFVDATLRQKQLGNASCQVQYQQLTQQLLRGISLRNLGPLTHNQYHDDKAWLALALQRAAQELGFATGKQVQQLTQSLVAAVDPIMQVLPWREEETFYNVPANGPAAILLAQTGQAEHLELAWQLTDWIVDHLIDHQGLVMDGLRMDMTGPQSVTAIYPYCQGVTLGACLASVTASKKWLGRPDSPFTTSQLHDRIAIDLQRMRDLVGAIALNLCTPTGVLDYEAGPGDGGLFAGILMFYLGRLATEIRGESKLATALAKVSGNLVLANAQAVWEGRLETDGLPLFADRWTTPAQDPTAVPTLAPSLPEIIPERDLSVQLSGALTLSAAAKVQLARQKR